MAIGYVVGGVFDNFREHVLNNAATHTTNVQDDFHSGAVDSRIASAPSRFIDTAYGTSVPGVVGAATVLVTWDAQLRQARVQT